MSVGEYLLRQAEVTRTVYTNLSHGVLHEGQRSLTRREPNQNEGWKSKPPQKTTRVQKNRMGERLNRNNGTSQNRPKGRTQSRK